jgi:serine/threonine-protein kinase
VDALLGTEVGSYRLIRVLGEGGMGRVYVGEQAEIASRVAIKVLTTKDPDLVARFFAEARAVNVIKHPGLVKVLALAHLPDGRPYIIMELVEGETLRTLVVRDAPLPIGGVLDVMKQLLAALGAAHARGVVHRDLKPDNVMITADGTVKVLDFGIAKLSTTLGGGNLTQVGAQIGTPAYMAPEQIRGDEVDARTDVYAAGVLLYEALTARHPFEAESEYELLKGHLESPPPRLSARRRNVPASLEPIVEKALAKKPADRYASAKELSDALEAAGVISQKLLARLPVSGPRSLPPRETDPVTVKERRVRDATADTPVAPLPRETVEYKRPSQKPIDATRAEKPAVPKHRRLWIAIAAVLLAGIGVGVTVIAWPRGQRQVSETHFDASAPSDAAVLQTTRTYGGEELRARIDVPVIGKSFDVIANITKATLLARQLVPNVVLTGFRVDRMNPNGRIDFDGTHVVAYYFAIPNLPIADPDTYPKYCRVGVTVTSSGWEALTTRSTQCGNQTQRIPTCTFAQVLQRAIFKTASAPATLEWLDGRWLIAKQDGTQNELADDCVHAASTTRVAPRDAGADAPLPVLDARVGYGPFNYTITELPLDFDSKSLDPIAYIPKATKHARSIQPDVELVSAYLPSIHRDGKVDIGKAHMTGYQFSTKGPANESKCTWVAMSFVGGKVAMARTEGNPCTGRPLPVLKCSVAQIWDRAQITTPTVSITLAPSGWIVGDRLYADDCK